MRQVFRQKQPVASPNRRMSKMSESHIGSSFDEFLQQESLLEEVTDVAIERVVDWLSLEASD